jgi:hypothetical protein
MPTGYTQMIIDGKVKSPKDFLHLCLRNFGVCLCMRDDEFKVEEDYTPKIMKFTQQSIDYHKNALQSAEEHLKQIQQLTEDQLYQKYVKENTKSREYYEEKLKEAHSINEKYNNFSIAIGKWDCSPEYENIKNFALEQLRISYDSTEYLEEQLAKIGDLSRESFQKKKDEYLNKLIDDAKWTINYHKDEMEKAISSQTEMVSFYHFFKQELEKLEA